MMRSKSTSPLRRKPLASALAVGLSVVAGFSGTGAFAATLDVGMPAAWHAGDRSGVAALMQALRDQGALRRRQHQAATSAVPVTRCADDGLGGTLREAVAAAGSGDTIDLSALNCSSITLSQGAIPILTDSLTIQGPASRMLAIDGAGLDRVFVHFGYGVLQLDNVTVRNGFNAVPGFHVAGGACIISNGNVVLDHSTVSGCTATGEGAYGGGILAGDVTLRASTLRGNVALGSNESTFTAAYGGGAFAYWSRAMLYDSTVSGNRAAHELSDTHGSYCTGGGIFADFGGYAYRSVFDSNYSYGTGGAVASHAGFNVSESTISGNTALGKAGGGLFVRLSDSMAMYNATVAGNQAFRGGGVYVAGHAAGLRMESTLIADNAASSGNGNDLDAQSSASISGSHNLVVSATTNVVLPGDTLQSDPRLLSLADNGGPTLTRALSIDSPAVDAGANPLQFAFDQRGAGFPRLLAGAPDIGAFEGTQALAAPVPVPFLCNRLLGVLAGLLGALGLWLRTRLVRR